MLQLFGTMIATQTYTVKNLSPGFYVENIGTANIDRGMFRIETVYKKERLNEDYIRIESALSKFKQLCDKADVATTDTHCNQFYHHLLEQKTKYERIKEYFTEFHETRRRRGLLGNFLTSVFGVNDEIYRDIDSLNSNQQKLIEASSHQTKIMISAISQVNGTEERIRHKLEGFQTKLSQVIERINSYDYWYIKTNHNDIKIQILQTFQVANNYIDEILNYYNGLLEVYLTKASVYSVLPPKNVSELIFSANRKMPSNIRIVQELLLDTRIVENMTHIQVHAYFPIKDITKYTLIHVTPVPKKNMNNTFESIEVSRAFLAIDYNNELYFELDHEEFKECIQRHEQFLCFPGVVKNMQLNENCIVDQLFKNQTNTKCPTHIFEMSSNIIWKQLCMQNSWLFITKTSSTISIVCDSKREEITIQDVGVIKIADNCIIKSVNNRLAAKRTLSIQVAESFSKQLNFSIYTYISNRSKN
ncbi:hypothetical protein HF086_016473 [Spodoptera exigua]|uniref:Uncharacterized protein n=1 Tax=Spodoptera exigua TaxID=7107 RepID=A0A922SNX5_SPOEX|nr:hypothetical protein HF086_013157 [Spodoptera exigua]KAH9643923.1 hypothetical protein HF086_016473 [Spodoptera exigua]